MLIPFKIVSLLSCHLKPAVLPLLQTFLKRVFQNISKVFRYNRFGGDNVVEYLPFSAIVNWGERPEVAGNRVRGVQESHHMLKITEQSV